MVLRSVDEALHRGDKYLDKKLVGSVCNEIRVKGRKTFDVKIYNALLSSVYAEKY